MAGGSRRILALVALLLLVMLVLSSGGSASASFGDSDGDGSIDVAEIIAGSDPNDPASGPESGGGSLYLGLPLCTDGIDNDLDGMLDGADPGCTDTDGDFVDDPVELAMGSDPNDFDSIPEDSLVDAVLVSLGFVTFQCNDGLDNDLDGVIDSADPGCEPVDLDEDGSSDLDEKTYGSDPNDAASRPEDDRISPALCADGVDNDLDGLTDGEDQGCMEHPTATPTTLPEETPPAGATIRPAATSTPPVVNGLPSTGSGAGGGSGAAGQLLLGLVSLGGLALAGTFAARAWWRQNT